MTAPVTVYWRRGCPFCLKLKAGLRLARIPYDGVDVWADPQGSETVRAVNGGDELVPTVRVGGRWLANPSVREVRRALREAAA